MVATIASTVERNREKFLAEMTEAALAVAIRDGTYATSVDLEIDFWNALALALPGRTDRDSHHRAEHAWEDRLAEWTDAAYRVLLRHRFNHHFIDIQLDLRNAFRHVIRRNRFLLGQPTNLTDSTRRSGMLAIR